MPQGVRTARVERVLRTTTLSTFSTRFALSPT